MPESDRELQRRFLWNVLRVVRLSPAAGGITTEDVVGHFQAGPHAINAALETLEESALIVRKPTPSRRGSEIRWFASSRNDDPGRRFGEALDRFLIEGAKR